MPVQGIYIFVSGRKCKRECRSVQAKHEVHDVITIEVVLETSGSPFGLELNLVNFGELVQMHPNTVFILTSQYGPVPCFKILAHISQAIQ
jgi:hypothetical protein